jgi:hypothetical protein
VLVEWLRCGAFRRHRTSAPSALCTGHARLHTVSGVARRIARTPSQNQTRAPGVYEHLDAGPHDPLTCQVVERRHPVEKNLAPKHAPGREGGISLAEVHTDICATSAASCAGKTSFTCARARTCVNRALLCSETVALQIAAVEAVMVEWQSTDTATKGGVGM